MAKRSEDTGAPHPRQAFEDAYRQQVRTVKMRLKYPETRPEWGNAVADVHPDEVANWKAGGWILAEE